MALGWGSRKKRPGKSRRGAKSTETSGHFPRITAKNIFRSLDAVRDACDGLRMQTYNTMAVAWQIVLLLRSSGTLKKRFIRRAKLGKRKRCIADEVLRYILRAETESMKKVAWKHSLVLQFLHAEGVKCHRIAREIEARGGIEAVYNQAVELMPLRKPKSAKEKLGKTDAEEPAENIEAVGGGQELEKPSPRANDKSTTLLLSIKMSDRDELSKMSVANLMIKRSNSEIGAKFGVLRVTKLDPNR